MMEFSNPNNIMANKTFVVTTVQAPPYTMLTEETRKMTGNDRFEGMSLFLKPIAGCLTNIL